MHGVKGGVHLDRGIGYILGWDSALPHGTVLNHPLNQAIPTKIHTPLVKVSPAYFRFQCKQEIGYLVYGNVTKLSQEPLDQT